MTEREQFEAWAKSVGWPHAWQYLNTDEHGFDSASWDVWRAARAQPAQATLTDDPLFVFAQEVIHGAYKPEELKDAAMRAIRHHSAVRAKMGVAVPMATRRITYTCPACHFSLERQE